MYDCRCLECGFIFESENAKYIEDVDGYRYFACPICKGRYESIKQCSCGNYILEEDTACEACKREVQSSIEDAFGDFSNNQIEYALEFIDEKWR